MNEIHKKDMNEITTKEYVEKISNIKSIDCDLVRKKFVD